MSNTSTMFTGASRYASDFQAVIDRAVAVASLRVNQLTNQKSTLQSQSTALSALDTKFAALQAAIENLESATGPTSYVTSISNGAIVSATIGDKALEATYSIEVTNLGSQTSTMSKDGLTPVTDPATGTIRSVSSFTLRINDVDHSIQPAAGTLDALVEAINDAGLDVEASVVNIGSSSAPDYRLALRSTRLGADRIELKDGETPLLDELATGVKAAFKLNGMATAIESDSRNVDLAPGLRVTLLGESSAGQASTVEVKRDTAGVRNALSAFATAYNAAVEEIGKHRGEGAGALSGQSILFTLTSTLHELAGYSDGPRAIVSLTELGLGFDDQGKIQLDTAAFEEATATRIEDLMSFLGSAAGGGFLKHAADTLDSVEDDTNGFLRAATEAADNSVAAQDSLIETEQDRVDLIRQAMVNQISAADALIAALEQQASYITSMFESMRIASQMYK